jgi:hypothetical protein
MSFRYEDHDEVGPRYQMIMTDEPVMSSQSFLHSKALPDMFIFARKDPAVLVVCNVYPIGKKNTSRPFTPFLLSIFYLYQILFDYRSERRR